MKKLTLSLLTGALLALSSVPINAETTELPYVKVMITADKIPLGWGSATYIGNGYFLTAGHVAEETLKSSSLTVVTDHYNSIDVAITFVNKTYDFAVVRAKNLDLVKHIPQAKLNCDKTFVGEHLTMHGNIDQIDFMQTQGFVMAPAQSAYEGQFPVVVPVDGVLIWGMSGGAAVNDNNEVVGINIALYETNGIVPAIGFIVPVGLACNELKFMGIDFN